MSKQIFTAANKLKDYSITIGGTELVKEVLISTEIAYNNQSPKVLGKIVIDDLYDLNHQIEWDASTVEVKYMDLFDTEVKKEFVILHISEIYDDKNDKSFVIELQDTFSYKLEHSYLCKSFTGNIITAIEDYISELDLGDYSTDFSAFDGTDEGFVIPQHINNLEAFLIELNKHGFTFYQTKTDVVIKSIDDLAPGELPDNGDEYLNETDNKLYMNRIVEMHNTFNKRLNVPPKTKAVAYDVLTKILEEDESNEISAWTLNSDTTDPQDTTGTRTRYQIHLDFAQNTREMKDQFISRSEIEIITNGYGDNDLNEIYELKLKGNKSTTETQTQGNKLITGKYISAGVVDKIIADTLIQKITLVRCDLSNWN